MTSNNQFTSPIAAVLSEHLYGGVTINRYHMVFCEDTCREWRPFDSRVFASWAWSSAESNDARFERLVEAEEEARTCQGHLDLHDMVRGMLRNYTFTPASDDRARDGKLSIIVLPWDDVEQRLDCKRTLKTGVFTYDMQAHSLYVTDGDSMSAMSMSFRPWKYTAM
jgi:hypothetical protein